jgi:hypothetical protein
LNESPDEVNMTKEILQGFLVLRERDFLDGFNPSRVYRDSIFRNDMA